MRFFTGPLKPNCLLTRYPVLFISEKRGLPLLFQNTSMGVWPSVAAEHGYETWNLRLPRFQNRTENILEAILKLQKPAHVICSPVLKPHLDRAMAKQSDLKSKIKSITYLANDQSKAFLNQRDLLLQHLGTLAEFDFLESTKQAEDLNSPVCSPASEQNLAT